MNQNPEVSIGIGSMIKRIKDLSLSYSNEELDNLGLPQRLEVKALEAILINGIVKKALSKRESRPPFGLVFGKQPLLDLDNEDPFDQLRNCMYGTLVATFDELKGHPDENSDFLPAYQRLQNIGSSKLRNEGYFDVNWQIKRGLYTGALMMSAILKVIPAVCLREGLTSYQNWLEVANNSFPMIARLSGGGRENFSVTNKLRSMQGVRTDSFQSNRLTLAENNGQTRLEIPNEYWDLQSPKSMDEGSGCPAIYKVDETSPMLLLWRWHLDIAKQIYPTLKPDII